MIIPPVSMGYRVSEKWKNKSLSYLMNERKTKQRGSWVEQTQAQNCFADLPVCKEELGKYSCRRYYQY